MNKTGLEVRLAGWKPLPDWGPFAMLSPRGWIHAPRPGRRGPVDNPEPCGMRVSQEGRGWRGRGEGSFTPVSLSLTGQAAVD